jgi:hypothetical protein
VIDLFRALAVLGEPPGSEQVRLAEVLGLHGAADPAAHTEVFTFQLYPYASVHVGAEGMLGGDALDRVAGFWRALRIPPPAEPDHLTALLGLYAVLAEREETEPNPARRILWRESRKALLWEHLASWVFPYLDKLQEIAPRFYRGWGALLAEALAREIEMVGPADALPLHLRCAPPLPDPRRDGGETFLSALLSSVRSGIIVTRADLARAAGELGLGLRMGERRFILQALLEQDPAGTLGWLAVEARRRSRGHRERKRLLGAVAEFWQRRAETTAALLAELRGCETAGAREPV